MYRPGSSLVWLVAVVALAGLRVLASAEAARQRIPSAELPEGLEVAFPSSMEGFTLDSVYVAWKPSAGKAEPVQRLVPRSRGRSSRAMHAQAEEAPPLLTMSMRDKVLTFLKMIAQAYPWGEYSVGSAYKDIFSSNQNYFVGNPNGPQAEEAGRRQLLSQWAEWLEEWVSTFRTYFWGTLADNNPSKQIGVDIRVYRQNDSSVIVFRGSFSDSDYDNDLLMYTDFIIYRWREAIINSYQSYFKQQVTGSMSSRGSGATEWFWNGVTQLVSSVRVAAFATRLADAAQLNPFQALDFGYWPVVKQMMAEILIDVGFPWNKVYLTGHSSGGSTAALVSMWVLTRWGVALETVTLEPVGSQCWMLSALRGDINSSLSTSHITAYRDAYSDYAALDVQLGNVCVYGIDRARQASLYCESLLGYPGAQRLLPEAKTAENCRYFVHNVFAIYENLFANTSAYALPPNGSTAGPYGLPCQLQPIIRPGDAQCASKSYTSDAGYAGWVIVFLVLCPLIVLLFLVYFPLRFLCLKCKCSTCGRGSWFPCCCCFTCCCPSKSYRFCGCCGFPCFPCCAGHGVATAATPVANPLAPGPG
eukprot:RCo013950